MAEIINIHDQAAVGIWVRALIADGILHEFYISIYWEHLRREVLAGDKNECQRCRSRGYYTKADTVHHVNHVKKYPELALSKTFVDAEGRERRNLISLCHRCHEAEHSYRQRVMAKPLTPERW